MRMQKKQFRIGELAKKLALEKFVIRFWEKEFNLKANRSTGKQRFYTETDLEQFKKIKDLLYVKGFTIAGAKKQLNSKNGTIIASQKTTFDTLSDAPNKFSSQIITLQQQLLRLRDLL